MRLIADLHLHSKYSRATSAKMDLASLTSCANVKGLNLLGTGDAFHPKWLQELRNGLEELGDSGIYRPRGSGTGSVAYITTTEVATVYTKAGRSRKIHHLILLPSLEIAEQAIDTLSARADLEADGRPVMSLTSPELVELLMNVSQEIEVIPAHIWTPWWSLFGAFNGFDSVEECYEDQTVRIHALETGLSSDPPMNWRLSALDGFALVSNSDSHSPYPHRLGREANIFETERLTYREILEIVRSKDTQRFLSTIETKPEYGKYHYSGHRNCGISLSGSEAAKRANICPRCGRRLTKGVEQRVEELADRQRGYVPPDVPRYHHILPLHELLSTVMGVSGPLIGRVQTVYEKLVKTFESEFGVTIFSPLSELEKVAGREIARAVQAVREDSVKVAAGYDGVYGIIEKESLSSQ